MRIVTALLIILLTSCSNTREINSTNDYFSIQYLLEHPNHQNIDKIKAYYFTPKAYKIIKSIPAIDGPAISGYSAGVNFWSNLASFLTCNGIGRKIIVPQSSIDLWGFSVFIHEYIHHLDDIDRDGEEEFINHEEFKKAYKMLANDMKWAGLYIWSEQMASTMIASDLFGVGDYSEQIAYVGQHLVEKGGPDYMKYVYRKILKLEYDLFFNYTTCEGKRFRLSTADLRQ